MQKSRRALRKRRALQKDFGRHHHLYTLSFSLVILLWIFLLNLWISYGDGHQDEYSKPALNVSSWEENKLESDATSYSVNKNQLASDDNNHLNTDTCAEYSYDTCYTDGVTIEEAYGEVQSGEDTRNNTQTDVSGSVIPAEVETAKSERELKTGTVKTQKTRTVPLGLDEFKKKALNSRNTNVPGVTGSVVHRMEPGGGVYNYASAAKGAKVLDSNKEAKGASNILNKDKDKYLRNPCSAENKFVVIELSEETLVDTIEIANFEHYSSNMKDFELLGSQVYPTETWVKLGNFSAGNVKHAQSYTLSEPKWVRYLKLIMLSHYGSEFYCTVSSVEVYGVDVVERMLEDLISVPDHQRYANGETEVVQDPSRPVEESAENNNHDHNTSSNNETTGGEILKDDEISKGNPDQVEEVRHPHVSRMPGDTVLKILMQKARTLDLSFSVLERYLEEVNTKYTSIFAEIDKEMEEKELVLEKNRLDIKNFYESKDIIAKDVDDLVAWRSLVSMQLDGLLKDNAVLRSDIRKVEEKLLFMESKGITIFLISLVFGFSALVMLLIDMVNSVYRPERSGKFCLKSSWLLLFLSCFTTIVILAL